MPRTIPYRPEGAHVDYSGVVTGVVQSRTEAAKWLAERGIQVD